MAPIEGSNHGRIWGSNASWTSNLGGSGSRSNEGYGLWSVRSGTNWYGLSKNAHSDAIYLIDVWLGVI